jgi:hypothetical protein
MDSERRTAGTPDSASALAERDVRRASHLTHARARDVAGSNLQPRRVSNVCPAVGLLDWFRPEAKPREFGVVARELAAAVFALHPAARDRVVITLREGAPETMSVPDLDAARAASPIGDIAELHHRISRLTAELGRCSPPPPGGEITVMRDRVIWMPSVLPFQPPIP